MKVIKRNGTSEDVDISKINSRIAQLSTNLDIDSAIVAKNVVNGIIDNITTEQLDDFSIQICQGLSTQHTHFDELAARIFVSNLHKKTPSEFSQAVSTISETGILNDDFVKFVANNSDVLDEMIVPEYDYGYDIFGLKTLERAYLMRVNDKILERPGYMLMRVAVSLYMPDIPKIEQCYLQMAQKQYTHATPTLFNAGTKRQQLASCFLQNMDDDIQSIFKTHSDSAMISKWCGGIGLTVSNIRGKGSIIKG